MAAATAATASWMRFKGGKERKLTKMNKSRINCSYSSSSSVIDPYKTLRIKRGASESEYHPDVCRGSNCGVQFHEINEAYDVVMSKLRGESNEAESYEAYYDAGGIDEPLRGMNDPDWDMWEEWMGWEGAGIRDYSSHINPYI
uniref:J domain-containing protein n=1 Tax=Glycine max TaxID=3847 RepID=I1KVN8_SOYBN